jgi:hypothetical protein
MKKKYIIFVIFHENINTTYYNSNLLSDLVFVNVDKNNPYINNIKSRGFHVINLYEFNNFISLGKQYAESEVIYNIFKNPYLIEDVDYVGFMQYDMHTHNLSPEELTSLIGKYQHIAFDEHSFRVDYKVGYLMDESYPEKWIGRGKNCYDTILEDYNQFYNTNHTIKELLPKQINLCCTFLLEKSHFNKMMDFISSTIESNKLDVFDKQRRFRMQGGLMERYFGLWLMLNPSSRVCRPVEHIFITSTVTPESFIRRIFSRLKKIIS